jgi:O-antigen/teichoic acid export membrane protein
LAIYLLLGYLEMTILKFNKKLLNKSEIFEKMERNLPTTPSRTRATVALAIGGYVNTGIVIAQGLLFLPLYLHYIGSHSYGLWLASSGIVGMLGLVNFGVGSMITQRVSVAYAQQNFQMAATYFINGAVIYFGICLLILISGIIVSSYLPTILKLEGNDIETIRQCFIIALLAMAIATFNEYLRSFSQALLRPVVSVIALSGGKILGLILSLWMLFNDFGLWAIPMGILFSESCILIVNLFYSFFLFNALKSRVFINKNIIQEYLRTSPALLGARAGQTIPQESEPLLITMFFTPELTTIYMIARRAADIVFNLLSQVVGSTFGTFSHLAGNATPEKISRVAYGLLSLIALLGLVGFSVYILMNEEFIKLWVGKEFVPSPIVISLLGIGFFTRIIRSMAWQLLNGVGDFVYASLCVSSEGIVRLGLIVMLLPVLGIVAMPIALIISCSLSFVFFMRRMGNKIYSNVEISLIVKYLVSVFVMFGGSIYIALLLNISSWLDFCMLLFCAGTGSLSVVFLMNRQLFNNIKNIFV